MKCTSYCKRYGLTTACQHSQPSHCAIHGEAQPAGASLQVRPESLNAGKCENSAVLITNNLKLGLLNGK